MWCDVLKPPRSYTATNQLCFYIFSELGEISQYFPMCVISWPMCIILWSPRQYPVLMFLCTYFQKHGLKVYMRDPHAFTPILEEGVGGAPPRSLTLGSDLAMNQREIGKFSQKDAQVNFKHYDNHRNCLQYARLCFYTLLHLSSCTEV